MDPKNSYQFFSNSACEFFPCHQVADTKTFNCLFCYCPQIGRATLNSSHIATSRMPSSA